MSENNNFNFAIDESLDEVVDERGNTMIALRKVSWDNREPKVELRRWYLNSDGEEKPAKGCTMITDDGPDNLAIALVKHGFGKTKDIVENIKDRDDFNVSMRSALTDDELENIKNTDVPVTEHTDLFDPMRAFNKEYEDDDDVPF